MIIDGVSNNTSSLFYLIYIERVCGREFYMSKRGVYEIVI